MGPPLGGGGGCCTVVGYRFVVWQSMAAHGKLRPDGGERCLAHGFVVFNETMAHGFVVFKDATPSLLLCTLY